MPDRETLEVAKLAHEVAYMELAWWKRPSYLGVFLPVGLAALTLATGWITGYFDAERTRLQTEKTSLNAEKKVLEAERDGLKTENADLLRNRDALLADIIKLKDGTAEVVAEMVPSLKSLKKEMRRKEGALGKLVEKLSGIDRESVGRLVKELEDAIVSVHQLQQELESFVTKLEKISGTPTTAEPSTIEKR